VLGISASTFGGTSVGVLSVSLSVLAMVDQRVLLSRILRLREFHPLSAMAFLLLTGRPKYFPRAVLSNGMIS